MATVLEKYWNLRCQVEQMMAQNPSHAGLLWSYGEVIYRISVLETCQSFCKSAPQTTDPNCLRGHYQMVDAFIQCMTQERRYGPDRGPNTANERNSAQNNLALVVTDYRSRFSSFNASAPDQYASAGRVAPIQEHLCSHPGSEGGNAEMSNDLNKQATIAAIERINAVEGFDPSVLAVDYSDLSSNETRRRLPVMSQMAWFRLKYPEGRIAVTVTAAKDCFVASARIYAHYNLPPDQYLAEATASRGYLPDKPTVSPREWAQTAAVGIALRNAGFGLQFSAAGDSFDTPAVDELGAITWSTAPAGETPTVGPTAPVPAPATTAPAPTAPELSPLEKAMRTPCPITRYKDKTLGDMVAADPNALVWIATKFTGDAEVIAAAKLICDQALASA